MTSISPNQDLNINIYVFEGTESIAGIQFTIKIDVSCKNHDLSPFLVKFWSNFPYFHRFSWIFSPILISVSKNQDININLYVFENVKFIGGNSLVVINSNKKVNIPVVNEFCQNTSLLVKSVPWIHIIPRAHVVLMHSAELIEGNNQIGLLNFTECGLEANNKFLRQYRMNYSRKTSQFDNLSNYLNRLWDKSDPMVNKTCERLHCSPCNTQCHTVRSCMELKKTEFEDLMLLLTL